MDYLEGFEQDQKLLSEVKELFQFVPPDELRRSIEDLFFHCFSDTDNPCLPNQGRLVNHIYLLINFLNEVE